MLLMAGRERDSEGECATGSLVLTSSMRAKSATANAPTMATHRARVNAHVHGAMMAIAAIMVLFIFLIPTICKA